MGRVTSSRQSVIGDTDYDFSNYTYNLMGNLTSITYPSGRVIKSDYDAAGRIVKVKKGSNDEPYGEASEYLPHGAIKTLKLGYVNQAEVMTETSDYSNRLQPILTRVQPRLSALSLLRLDYYYCPGLLLTCTSNNGNLHSQRISYDAIGGEAASWANTQGFTYDKLNRLNVFSEVAATETNSYDRWGNRWATVSGLSGSPLTPAGEAWFNQTNNNRMWGVGYDAAGNQTQVNPFTLAYDPENRVSAVSSPGNGEATYSYDAEGRRVKKTANGVTTVYVYL